MPTTRPELPDAVALTDSMALALRKASPRDRRLLHEMVQHYIGELRRVAQEDPVGMSAAYTAHLLSDEAVSIHKAHSRDSERIQCRKGCAHCCRQFVAIWPGEARLLRAYAAELGLVVDEARLTRQAGRSAANWNRLAPEDRACVFLAPDGSCRVYEHRPNVCRKYFAVSDPDHCNTVKHPGGKVLRWVAVEAEAIETAARTVNRGGGMADELLRAAHE